MTRKKIRKIVKIRYSCLTGKPVWVCHKLTYKGEYTAYKRACEREIERIKHWDERMAERKRNIMQLLNKLTASLPIDHEWTPEQLEGARELKRIAAKPPECDKEFYNHIMEERRRRSQEKAERKQRKLKNQNNQSYDK